MKKILLSLLLSMILIGCQTNQKTKILIPEGIPSIALGDMLDNESYDCSVLANADVITSELVQSNYDIIIAPITAGAKLYLQGASSYQLAAILTFNNLYIFARNDAPLNHISDLNNATIAAFGYNNTPDIILRYALDVHEIKANIVYEASVHDVLSNRLLIDDTIDYFLLTEPVLSMVTMKLALEGTIFSLHEALFGDSNEIPQAGVFIHQRVFNKELLLSNIANHVAVMQNDIEGHVSKLMQLDKERYPLFSRLGNELLIASIPRSEIRFVRVKDAKQMLNDYFGLLNSYNRAILQGQLPNEAFYYE
ncbi:MAG: hypothetical protein M0R05_05520 [Bacilli bacterium]|nr:hypothetical protein [Bacilli bacterium]